MHSFHLNTNYSIMKIVLVLVVFLDYALTPYAGINPAETSVIRLTEGVPSPECNEGGCLVQDKGVNLMNAVTVYKRHAKHKTHKQIRKHKGKKSITKTLKAILKRINKAILRKKKKTINLGRKLKLKILNLNKNRKNNILSLAKHWASDAYLLDLYQQVVASRMYAQGSAQVLMDKISTTVTSLKKLLVNGATNIEDLATLFLAHIKEFANSSKAKLQAGKTEEHVQTKEFQVLDKLSEVGNRKIFHAYNMSEMQVMDLASTGADSILEAADKEAKQFQIFDADDKKLKRYIKFTSRKIYDLAKYIADKYIELALGCLESLKQFALDVDKTVKRLALLEIQKGQDIVKDRAASSKINETTGGNLIEFDDKNKHEFKEVIGSIAGTVKSVLKSASTQIDVIRKCSTVNPTCVVH